MAHGGEDGLGDLRGGLVVHSTIRLETTEGQREIQLCFGDITKLPVEQKVDILLVSAFQGDYTPTATSLIGALYRHHGLKVGELARNKKEDLRQHFYCWLSHPLPDHLPYGQVLCFETPWIRVRSFRHPSELVSDVFRCLIPIFENQEKTVITPLLATGDQRFDRKVMLKAMLDAAISWVRAGLPLKCLKIVIYNTRGLRLNEEEKKLVSVFEKLQADVEQFQAQKKPEEKKKAETEYDVYMAYNPEDESRVTAVRERMKEELPNISIFCHHQQLNSTSAFQDDILQKMKTSRRVVTFLSPSFLKSSVCVEQYNLALCCNRKTAHNILAPFYIETVTNMPTYMTLVQYIDVRNRDGTDQRLVTGVKTFVLMLKVVTRHNVLKSIHIQYDVFISYCHRDTEKAHFVLNVLRKHNPDINIFFDKNELKTGTSWQQSLYNALDNSKVVVALLSPDYLTSQVCMEEFNLALCRHVMQDEDGGVELIPVMIESIDSIPRQCAHVPVLNGTEYFAKTTATVTIAIGKYRTHGERNMRVFHDLQETFDIAIVLEKHRQSLFETHFEISEGRLQCKSLNEPRLKQDAENYRKTDEYKAKLQQQQGEDEEEMLTKILREKKAIEGFYPPEEDTEEQTEKDGECDLNRRYDVAFICANPAHGYVINSLLFARAPQLTTNFSVDSEQAELLALDNCRLCLVFFSPTMASTSKDVEEFHVALARQRKTAGVSVLYPIIVEPLQKWPTYLHLVPCRISTSDHFWSEIVDSSGTGKNVTLPDDVLKLVPEVEEKFKSVLEAGALLALSAACDDIISILQRADQSTGNERNIVLHNMIGLALHNRPTGSGNGLAHDMVPIEKVLRSLEKKPTDETVQAHTHEDVVSKDFRDETEAAAAAILARRHRDQSAEGSPANKRISSQSCSLL